MLILQLSWAPLSSSSPPLGFLAKVQHCLRSHQGLSLGKSAVARQLPDTSESWSATEDEARERDRKRGWDEFFWGLFKPSHPVKVTAKRNIQTHLSHIFNAALFVHWGWTFSGDKQLPKAVLGCSCRYLFKHPPGLQKAAFMFCVRPLNSSFFVP